MNTICPVFAVVVLVVTSVVVVSIQWPWIQKHGHMPKYIDDLIKEIFSQDLFANLQNFFKVLYPSTSKDYIYTMILLFLKHNKGITIVLNQFAKTSILR